MRVWCLLSICLLIISDLCAQQKPIKAHADSTAFYTLSVSSTQLREWVRVGQLEVIRKLADETYVVRAATELTSENLSGLKRLTHNDWKMAGKPLTNSQKTFSIATTRNAAFMSYCQRQQIQYEIVKQHSLSNTLVISVASRADIDQILSCPHVVFADPHTLTASEETEIAYADNSVNKVNVVHHKFPELTGAGLHVSVKERAFDVSDIDLKGRIVPSALADEEATYHANQMATLIAGAGNTTITSRGVAWGANISSSSFDNLLPDDDATLVAMNVSVQNHSYGTLIENYYGVEARAYDLASNANTQLLHVFSSGNLGSSTSNAGKYAGLAAVATLSGNFKQSKNTLCVSSTYQDLSMDERTSSGPAYDGRLKPELVAYGQDGTSDAAAITSGIGLLVQQAYVKKNNQLPSASMVKAILVASADDLGQPGPDYKAGFGALNAIQAVELVNKEMYLSGSITPGQEKVVALPTLPSTGKITVVLSWNDPATQTGSVTALVNNLDVTVSNATNTWKPWVLSTVANRDSLAKPARRGPDAINNIEMVTVDLAEAGTYQVHVRATSLSTTLQNFEIAYWYEAADDFYFTYPTQSDVISNSKPQYIRWKNTLPIDGPLEVKYNNGPWEELAPASALTNGFYRWQPPAIFTQAALRMQINGSYHESDAFVLSPTMPLTVGYDCTADFLLAWQPQQTATGYEIFSLGEKYMEPLASTTDTFRFVVKQPLTPLYYAVAPTAGTFSGMRGIAYNYQSQGVSCYYTAFTSTLTSDNTAKLRLALSTRYNVQSIRFEEVVGTASRLLGIVDHTNALAYEFIDEDLEGGVNRYRALIELKDGRTIETEPTVVYFGDETTFDVFPNPVSGNELVTLLTDGDNLTFYLYDVRGKEIKQEAVFGSLYRASLQGIQPGVYMYRFKRFNKVAASGRLLVR